MKKSFLVIFILFFVLTTFTASITSSAQTKNEVKQNINKTEVSSTKLTPQQVEKIATIAALMLNKVAQARLDIHVKDYKNAVIELKQSLFLVEVIKISFPTTEIQHYVSIAKKHLPLMDAKDIIPDLIPIEVSLDEVNDIINANVVEKYLKKVEDNLKQGKKQKAALNLQAIEYILINNELDLPLGSTELNIVYALKALQKKEPKKADALLEAIENNVKFFVVTLTGLEKISHGLLWKATKNYADGNIKGALKNLKRAEDNINKLIAKTENSKIKKNAKKLLAKIKKLEKEIKK